MARYRRDIFRLAEAALVGLFFVQAFRFVYGTLYAHVASANLVSLTGDPSSIVGVPGVVSPIIVRSELILAGIALFMPLLAVIFSRLWFGPALIALIVAAGRVFVTANGTTPIGVYGGIIAAGAAALYIATIAIRRPGLMPVCLVVGFAGDQLIRLYGNTADITVTADFLPPQTLISLIVFAIAVMSAFFERLTPDDESTPPHRGEISGWGAFALGGLLYLEFAVLGLSNTVARRAGVEYISVAPWLTVATLLPLVAEVREWARRFLGMFDGQYRGWVWFLLIALLLVIGFRFSGTLALVTLILAQLIVSLSWWWIVQPSAAKGDFTGPGVVFGLILFLLITGADYFTYAYAIVRGVPEPLGAVLRGFRGMGLVVVLFATLLSGLPAILARKRLPWLGGRVTESLLGLAVVVGAGVLAGTLARPLVTSGPSAMDELRIATINLHGGYSLYYNMDLPGIEHQIRAYGADVVMLQEVEAGRLESYGVDQAAWLARQLNMQVVYYPSNEGMQGLAVLSRLPILEKQGWPLPSIGTQTGIQFVRLLAPDQAQLNIYNTELGLLLRGTDQSLQAQEQDQTTQIQVIFGLLSQNDPSLTNRTVIGGTFNNVPGSDIYQYLAQSGFSDPFAGMPSEKAITLQLVNGGTARVDYLWLRNITSRFVGIVPMAQSSHSMSVVEIGLLQASGG